MTVALPLLPKYDLVKESQELGKDAEIMIANISSEIGTLSVLKVFWCVCSLLMWSMIDSPLVQNCQGMSQLRLHSD